MRRIILAACAAVLLHAAPSVAAECTNLALPANGGTVSVSSAHTSWPARSLNSGRREDTRAGIGTYYWTDDTRWVYPDWAQIEWSTARTLDRIVVRAAVPAGNTWWGGYPAGERTLARSRVQYWDAATAAWIDVVGTSEQSNPIVNWVAPFSVADGSEIKQFDLATPISTTKIRVLIEEGNTVGYSTLEEIEAYDDCAPPPTECSAAEPLAGTASASSTHSSGLYPVSGVNNGRRESGTSQGYWNDDTNGVWPDWVQIAFATPQTIGRIVARIPLARREFPLGEITLRRTRIQYWDDTTSTWTDVAGRSGQDNPIIDWQGPIETYDGSESRTFDLTTPVTTTKIRALIEEGSTDGWSWLDELEAYAADCVTTPSNTNIARPSAGGTAFASSQYNSGWPITALNDGRLANGSGYWNSAVGQIPRPHWAGIAWATPRTFNRVVLRGPWLTPASDPAETTLNSVLLQWWDDRASLWRTVSTTQPNPILNWMMPARFDGTEIKQWDFSALSTSRVRVWIDQRPQERFAYLDEFEVYRIS